MRSSRRQQQQQQVQQLSQQPTHTDKPSSLPSIKQPGVISLTVLAAHYQMEHDAYFAARIKSWPEVPIIRSWIEEMYPGQTLQSGIQLLIDYLVIEKGLTLPQAKHVSLAEVISRL